MGTRRFLIFNLRSTIQLDDPVVFSQLLFPGGLPTWALFAEMLLAGSVVIFAGVRFTKLADAVADRLNLGAGWAGLIMLATVTSLPELVTGGTATAIGNVDLGLGAILGSCSFNITLIVLLNVLWGGGSVLRSVSALHVLTSSFGLLLIGMALLGIVVMDKLAARPHVAQIVEVSWAALILVTYLGCMRLTYSYERRNHIDDHTARPRRIGTSLAVQMALIAIVLVAASWWLARLGDVLSTHEITMIGRPLGSTFVGAGFLALAKPAGFERASPPFPPAVCRGRISRAASPRTSKRSGDAGPTCEQGSPSFAGRSGGCSSSVPSTGCSTFRDANRGASDSGFPP